MNMKKFFLVTVLLFGYAAAGMTQITDVEVRGQWLYVYGENNKQLCTTTISSDASLEGFGSGFYVIRQGQWLYTKNSKCETISSMTIGSDAFVRGVGGNTFTIKHGQWILTYDRFCKQISSRTGD
jgi:hypothetical protein